ncbi:MAG: hypothetical protein MUD16_08880 [Desulfobacterales bacterium]|jgi:hypothetical protein|nr:hypothetical protein [Desulfobacterales bacterium]
MAQQRQHYTMTMARLLAEQGHWQGAADIYRHLLRENPGRAELCAALAEAERRLGEKSPKAPADLVPLFEEWIRLVFKAQRLRRLRQLQRSL